MSLYQSQVKKIHKGLSWASNFLKADFYIVGNLFDLKICFDIFSLLYTKQKYSELSNERNLFS